MPPKPISGFASRHSCTCSQARTSTASRGGCGRAHETPALHDAAVFCRRQRRQPSLSEPPQVSQPDGEHAECIYLLTQTPTRRTFAEPPSQNRHRLAEPSSLQNPLCMPPLRLRSSAAQCTQNPWRLEPSMRQQRTPCEGVQIPLFPQSQPEGELLEGTRTGHRGGLECCSSRHHGGPGKSAAPVKPGGLARHHADNRADAPRECRALRQRQMVHKPTNGGPLSVY